MQVHDLQTESAKREDDIAQMEKQPASRLSDAAEDMPKAGKASEASSTTARVTTLGKSVRINTTSTTPTGTAPK
jgi:hypothetical protein